MHRLIIAGGRDQRLRLAEAYGPAAASSSTSSSHLPLKIGVSLDAAGLPFSGPTGIVLPHGARLLRIDDLELAFPDRQVAGTRLVLTQSTYLIQALLDALRDDDVIVATADPVALRRNAPEAFQGRGPWRQFDIITGEEEAAGTVGSSTAGANAFPADRSLGADPLNPVTRRLADGYATASVEERLSLCRAAAEEAPESAVAQLALASACREHQQIDEAREALDRTIELAPQWAAAHFEDGKFWLGCDNMELACQAFQRAADAMPAFAAAFSNLGATLGELDQPEAALAAFEQALTHDPGSITLLNNVGVVSRELGRLDASEAALAQVTGSAPEFVFGHYNLGHTKFLNGDFPGALAAYEEGRQRDPEKNRRQGCRLALVRLALGDLARAETELFQLANEATADEREDLLLEAYEIAQALFESRPELGPHRGFLERLADQITL